MLSFFRSFAVVSSLFALLALSGCSQSRQMSEQDELMEKARLTATSMFGDPNYSALLGLATDAKALLIAPSVFRGAFFFGARGGNAVVLTKGENGNWNGPAFYVLGGINWGLQFGAQSSELILVIMSERGLKAIMNRKATLGADAGLALAEIGGSAQASSGLDLSADVYAFARSEGVYAGVAIDGSVIEPRVPWNEAVYGAGTTPEAILIQHSVTPPAAAASLIAAMPK
jgi:SH3 domain-containing YSC84-like protein 1